MFPLRVISFKDPVGLQRDRRREKERQNKNYKKKIITPMFGMSFIDPVWWTKEIVINEEKITMKYNRTKSLRGIGKDKTKNYGQCFL